MPQPDPTPQPIQTDTAAASTITDHPFVSRGEWWERCHCGLGEAAHRDTTLSPEDRR